MLVAMPPVPVALPGQDRPMPVKSSMQNFQDEPQLCRCPKFLTERIALLDLLTQPLHERIFQPSTYLAASCEVFAYTLVVTWILTFFMYPEQIMDHPARPIIGSFNPCFGWDYAPASYIALTCCSVNVFLTWRYTWCEQTRSALLSKGSHTWVQVIPKSASIWLALSSNVWLLLWLIGPNADQPKDSDGPVMKNWFGHTGIFINYLMALYLASLMNYLEVRTGPRSHVVETKHTAFIIIYGISGTYLTVVYFYDLLMYEFGRKPALPPIFTQAADIFWMACMGSIKSFLPPEQALKMTVEVLSDAELALE